MRHNKFIGWDTFLGVVERVEKLSPWLSRQLTKRASEWPFWFSGLVIEEWQDRRVRVKLPISRRNSLDGEITMGHLMLGAELSLRLLLLRYREEFPFNYRVRASQVDVHHKVDRGVEYRFAIELPAWEAIRQDLARAGQLQTDFVFPAYLDDGRSAATFTFTVGFTLEKYLAA